QDLIRAAQLTVLALEVLDALGLRACDPRALARVGLRLAHPTAQRLRGHPELLGDRRDRRPLRLVLALLFEHHPRRPLTDLTRIRRLPWHMAQILSRDRAAKNRGAVHCSQRQGATDSRSIPRSTPDQGIEGRSAERHPTAATS